jgi:hypothetical protein
LLRTGLAEGCGVTLRRRPNGCGGSGLVGNAHAVGAARNAAAADKVRDSSLIFFMTHGHMFQFEIVDLGKAKHDSDLAQ